MSIHAYGYEGKVEEAVPVEEIQRARCTLCEWVGQEFDGLSWEQAEAEAVQHYEDEHDDGDEEEE